MNRVSLLMTLQIVLGTVTFYPTAGRIFAQDEKAEAEDGEGRIEFLNNLADEHLLAARSGEKLAISKESVLNYSNPGQAIGAFVGTTKVWLQRKRPIAVCCFSMRVPNERVYYEMVSLVDEELECTRDGTNIWMPAATDSNTIELDGIADAANPKRRLFQMRRIARQFQAHGIDRDPNEKNPFRLLSQPIYRYSDDETGIVDGALFAFAVVNDPELLLQIEAVKTEAADKLVWQYRFARMTSWRVDVFRDGEKVWTVPNFYASGGRRLDRSYYEDRLGYFADGEMKPSPQ